MSNEQCCFATKPQSNGDDCCIVQPKGKTQCPICGEEAKGVLAKTLDALLTPKAKDRLDSLEGFYYCKTSTCRAIYFRGIEVLNQNDLSVSVGLKADAKVKNYCYCFGWTKEKMKEDIKQNGTSSAIADIQSKMKSLGCSCEVKNPSGKCCQVDVKKALKEILDED